MQADRAANPDSMSQAWLITASLQRWLQKANWLFEYKHMAWHTYMTAALRLSCSESMHTEGEQAAPATEAFWLQTWLQLRQQLSQRAINMHTYMSASVTNKMLCCITRLVVKWDRQERLLQVHVHKDSQLPGTTFDWVRFTVCRPTPDRFPLTCLSFKAAPHVIRHVKRKWQAQTSCASSSWQKRGDHTCFTKWGVTFYCAAPLWQRADSWHILLCAALQTVRTDAEPSLVEHFLVQEARENMVSLGLAHQPNVRAWSLHPHLCTPCNTFCCSSTSVLICTLHKLSRYGALQALAGPAKRAKTFFGTMQNMGFLPASQTKAAFKVHKPFADLPAPIATGTEAASHTAADAKHREKLALQYEELSSRRASCDAPPVHAGQGIPNQVRCSALTY